MPKLLEARKRYVQTLEQVKRPLSGAAVRSLQELDRLTAKVPYPRDAAAAPLHRLESAAELSFGLVERVVAAQKELVLNGVGAVTAYVERPRVAPTSAKTSPKAARRSPVTKSSGPTPPARPAESRTSAPPAN
jgi:hypothetical protein